MDSMTHEIVSLAKPHSWAWMLSHSRVSAVEKLMRKGFGSIAILPYTWEQNGVRNYGKKVVIHCGSMVRIISFTNDWSKCEDYTQ